MPLEAGEALVSVSLGPWSWLVPLSHLERVEAAALPSAYPAEGGGSHAALQLGAALVPVVFGRALLGASEVALEPSAKILVLRSGASRAALWVDAVDAVVSFEPWEGALEVAPQARQWLAGFCAGFPALPVLDVPRLVHAASAALAKGP